MLTSTRTAGRGASRSGLCIRWLLAHLAVVAACLLPGLVAAQPEPDPPGRVGRVADLQGPVWIFDLEEGRWAEAQRNRPVTAGDRLATGRDARAELRIGSTTLKLAEGTELEMLRLDDERVRVHLHRGSVALRLRSREVAAETSFGTDEAWLQPLRGGLYRLDRQDDTTLASSWRGELRVDEAGGLEIESGRRLQLWREGPQRQLQSRWLAPVEDAFAVRVLREDRDDERTASAAYVSPEMTGWEELDRHGRWDQHPEYGAVWVPLSVRSDWAPYRQGRWTWLRPWGWTWIDEAPWGFAPFHYGRWVTWRDRWTWVPGRYVPRPVFAPALVGWIDGPAVGIGLRVGGPTLSWVPLAPWEVFRPHYRVSPGYHDRVNTSDHRQWRPPQRIGTNPFGNQGVSGAVTVISTEVLRPRTPGVREGRDDPRPRVPGTDRDRDRNPDRTPDPDRDRPRDRDPRRPPDEVRVTPPPPTLAPTVPMPTRPQPVQPVQPVPERPAPPAPLAPPLARPVPVQPPAVMPVPVQPQPVSPQPAQPQPQPQPVQPPPPRPTEPPPKHPHVAPPPVQVPVTQHSTTTGVKSRPVPPVEVKSAPKEREKDAHKEPPKEEPKPKPSEGKGPAR